ncbi:hypothetical protein O9K51_09776 [Purpureocillium lavendulum]|uniref:DUF6594 domain-containing protein n=1 Tax=Purpureocillium lavendulum TaxID=1247861 RepID=A0AB34FFA5_9HYPO|nr:hypothetical protein O9K51_09776 [Purpureocillium lavendulum]
MQSRPNQSLSKQFPSHWLASTADSNLTLHGFRRFKTTHLLNLRYLETEIAQIDRLLYQLGLSLDLGISEADRLGLKHCERDEGIPPVDEAVSRELITTLRGLVKEYDEAILRFANIMSMDTFSLLDDKEQSHLHKDLTLHEMFKTRLLRVDQAPRTRQDPLQRSIHHFLRLARYNRICASSHNTEEAGTVSVTRQSSSQNTALISDVIARFVLSTTTALFLIVPLVVLSQEARKSIQILVVSVCIVAFACLVSLALRVSNVEMMIVCAAYAAIISVFVSNSPTSN